MAHMDPPNSRCLKRYWTSSPALSPSPPPPHVKHSVQWFEDRNIVLEAKWTQFCVYHGILSENSVIFKDMFDLSQPGSGREVEGCPLVHLSDRVEDLHHMLQALHDLRGYVSSNHPMTRILLTYLCLEYLKACHSQFFQPMTDATVCGCLPSPWTEMRSIIFMQKLWWGFPPTFHWCCSNLMTASKGDSLRLLILERNHFLTWSTLLVRVMPDPFCHVHYTCCVNFYITTPHHFTFLETL